jgi:predicted permease
LRAYVNLPGARYTDRTDSDAFYDALTAELRRRPGVSAVGIMSGLPPSRNANNTSILPDGRALADLHTGLPPIQYLQFVTPGFFAALDVPLMAGRLLTEADRRGSEPVALLNQRAADVYFPGGDVVGRRIRFFQPGAPWVTVVGVVGDLRQGGLEQPAGTEVFLPVGQADNAGGASMTRDLNVVVRVDGDPLAIATDVRAIARRLDPLAAISGVETMATTVRRSVAGPRFLAFVLGALALVALVLSASGVYGVVRHTVGARTREIGVRRALGASTRSVVSLVLRQAAVLIAAGAGVGALLALAASSWLEPFVFEVPTGDPARPLLVACVLAGVAVAACSVPLVRAVRIDPAETLRQR